MQNMGTEVISMQNLWQNLLSKPGPNVTGNATKGNKLGKLGPNVTGNATKHNKVTRPMAQNSMT
jgi:hypothetical protein